MMDSETKEKISISYLPPPLGSLQTGGLKADNVPGIPLKGAREGVRGVGERKGRKGGAAFLSTAYHTRCHQTSRTYYVSWTYLSGMKIYTTPLGQLYQWRHHTQRV